MVRKERLELSRREALEPKSSVSTNSTTPANFMLCCTFYRHFTNVLLILHVYLCYKNLGCKRVSHVVRKKWGGRWGLNPRPLESQSRALPTELRPPRFTTFPDSNYIYYPFSLACLLGQYNGASGRIRTCDHPLRRRVLYPAELRTLVESKS